MMTEEQLKIIAAQLAHPTGTEGIAAAKQMEVNNANMILSAISALQLNGNETVLEIGFGNGAHVPQVLQFGSHIQYTGVDISETMQGEALQTNQSAVSSGQASFIVVDGIGLPFIANTFDKFFSVNTIYFWNNPAQYLAEIFRVLKPHASGVLAFAEKSFMEQLPFVKYGFRLFRSDEVEKLLVNAGFISMGSVVTTEKLTTGSGEIMERPFVLTSFIKP